MRRTPLFRTLAMLLAVWFPLVAGEPVVPHPCPMHGQAVAGVANAGADMPGMPGMHMNGRQVHQGSPKQSAPGHHHSDCTCIGCCVVAAALLRSSEPPTVAVATIDYVAAPSVPSVESLARPAPEYARPFTTGPPRA